VTVGNRKLRLLLTILASYPLENVNVVGHFTTAIQPPSATSQAGAVDDALFSTDAGRNCQPAL